MIENLIVAFSNFPCVLSIHSAYINKDMKTLIILIYLSCASFLFHLVENHKHDMPGIFFSKKISLYLNRLDLLGCFFLVARFIQLYYTKYKLSPDALYCKKIFLLSSVVSFILLLIPSIVSHHPKRKNVYIVFHSLWHMCIFMVITKYLNNFIYNRT